MGEAYLPESISRWRNPRRLFLIGLSTLVLPPLAAACSSSRQESQTKTPIPTAPPPQSVIKRINYNNVETEIFFFNHREADIVLQSPDIPEEREGLLNGVHINVVTAESATCDFVSDPTYLTVCPNNSAPLFRTFYGVTGVNCVDRRPVSERPPKKTNQMICSDK